MGNSSNGLDRSPVHLLHRAAQCAEVIFHAEVNLGGLTPRQFAVLVTVARDEGLTQTAVVELHRDRPHDRGLRCYTACRGRGCSNANVRAKTRARTLSSLTEEGRRVLRTAEPLAETVDERILEALSGTRRAQFIGALQTIASILQRISHGTVAKTA